MRAGWFSAVATRLVTNAFCCEQGMAIIRSGLALSYAELEIQRKVFTWRGLTLSGLIFVKMITIRRDQKGWLLKRSACGGERRGVASSPPEASR
jgi:hypothetical protein